ncbi:MAG: hypothetical protein JNL82_39835 [Myxococcales bacterium]|nr:hypothetical protein [Myxococcales bacterium]
MATEDWIQESLARLESLEEERNKHEAALESATDPATLRMHTQAIERLDTKIRALYAELEAVADQSGGGGDDEDDDDTSDDVGDDAPPAEAPEVETRLFRREEVAAQAAAAGAASPFKAAAAAPAPAQPVVAAAPAANPFGGGAAQPVAQTPFGGVAAPAANPFGGAAQPVAQAPFGGASSGSFDDGDNSGFSAPSSFNTGGGSSFGSGGGGSSFADDDTSSGGGAKWGIIIAVVVILGGIGGYFALSGGKETPPPPEPTGPTQVIRAGEVPPDTQGPKSIKGGNAEGTKGSNIKEGRPEPRGGNSGGSNTPSTADKPKKKDPKTKIDQTDDPLAGIDK